MLVPARRHLCLLGVLAVALAWCGLADAQTAPADAVVNGGAERAGDGGVPAGWSLYVRKGHATLRCAPGEGVDGRGAARLDLLTADSNYSVVTGVLNVPQRQEEAAYVLTADVKSEAPQNARIAGYFCAGAGDYLKVGNVAHNAGWQKVRVVVVVPAGKAFGRLDFNGGGGPAVILIDNVRLTPLDKAAAEAEAARERKVAQVPEAAIPLKPGTPTLVRKVAPLDSRLVRGIAHAPVDGRTDTRHAKGGVGEWCGLGGLPAVNYRLFNGNNGLHVALPEGGFDSFLARGGWRGKVYADYDGLMPPDAGRAALCEVAPKGDVFRCSFETPVLARRLSFFYSDKEAREPLADVSFLRVRQGARFEGGQDAPALAVGDALPAEDAVAGAIAERFGKSFRAFRLREGAGAAVSLRAEESLHLVTPAQDTALGIAGVTFGLDIAQVAANAVLTARVQDALDLRREVMSADFNLPGPGRYVISLDTPDQVLLPPREQWPQVPRIEGSITPPPVVWVTVSCGAAMELRGATVTLHRVAREKALAEAGAWRKLLLRGMFSTMSEPRPWMNLTDKKPIREQIGEDPIKPYALSVTELLETAEVARALLPGDDVVRQYHEWLYQNMDRRKPKPPPQVAAVPGAPEWAVLARESWREMAAIANWWLANRLVADGELGGGVNDDTDLFQVWQCLPMVESAPLGAALKDAAARLSDLAVAHKLEEGINRNSMDSLHAYEEGVNQLALCAWWFYGDPVHFERAMESARSVMKLMVETPDGRLHFPSDVVGIEQARKGYPKVEATPGDGNWAPVRYLLHPAYVVAWYNRNPGALERYSRWGATWAGYQKPGEFVGKVEIATGKPILSAKPVPTAQAIGPVDDWLALYQVTGDAKWQAPFKQLLDAGGYCGTTTAYGRCAHALVDWGEPYQEKVRRKYSGPSSGYAGFFLTKDRGMLEQWLKDSASWFGRFRYMNADAEQKTDRILTLNASAPISCYLGDAPNRNRYLNFTAVSYEGLRGGDFAALVWDAGPEALRVAIHNFTDKPLAGRMRVWRLDHGRYKVGIGPDADDDGRIDEGAARETVAELARYSAISLDLPPHRTTVVRAEQVERLDDLLARADLAVSALDMRREADGTVAVQVHNIGAKAASDVRVALQRGGKTIREVTIPRIDAPNDLRPRMTPVRFRDALAGDVIMVDPENAIPEIAEHNNRLVLSTGG